MKIRQYDTVLLKDGRQADIVEVLAPHVFIADVGSSPKDWDIIDITLDMIERQISDAHGAPYPQQPIQ